MPSELEYDNMFYAWLEYCYATAIVLQDNTDIQMVSLPYDFMNYDQVELWLEQHKNLIVSYHFTTDDTNDFSISFYGMRFYMEHKLLEYLKLKLA